MAVSRSLWIAIIVVAVLLVAGVAAGFLLYRAGVRHLPCANSIDCPRNYFCGANDRCLPLSALHFLTG